MAVDEPIIFYPRTAGNVTWKLCKGGTQRDETPVPITDATGSATLYDEYGQPVPGATNLAFGAGDETGLYMAPVDPTSFNPRPGRNYRLQISMTSPSLDAPAVWNREAWIEESGPL